MLKKVFIVFVFMVFMFIFTSCSQTKKEVTVTYVINELNHVTVMKQNSRLHLEDVPKIENIKYLGMYMDNKFTIEYSGEIIDEDVTLYVKTAVEELGDIDENIEKQIIVDFYNKFVSTVPVDKDAVIKNVWIKHYYGNYNGAYVVMMASSELGHFNWLGAEEVDGIKIFYNNSTNILVWHDGDFYNLTDAFNKNYIMKTNLIAIANYQKQYYPFLYKQ